jgi:hypothetical protein
MSSLCTSAIGSPTITVARSTRQAPRSPPTNATIGVCASNDIANLQNISGQVGFARRHEANDSQGQHIATATVKANRDSLWLSKPNLNCMLVPASVGS